MNEVDGSSPHSHLLLGVEKSTGGLQIPPHVCPYFCTVYVHYVLFVHKIVANSTYRMYTMYMNEKIVNTLERENWCHSLSTFIQKIKAMEFMRMNKKKLKLNAEDMFVLVLFITFLPVILLYRVIFIAAMTAWLWAIPVALLILVLK